MKLKHGFTPLVREFYEFAYELLLFYFYAELPLSPLITAAAIKYANLSASGTLPQSVKQCSTDATISGCLPQT
ncbi:MAG: hypothetical protein IGS39_20835 [Calothrix sp. C42_A2020_038]|nr:hypothetical protein [Calothrix sp. C42_A2020_038]